MAPSSRPSAKPDPGRSTSTATGDPPSRRGVPPLSLRINVTLPEGIWMRTFTKSHPDLRLEVSDRLEIGNRLTLLEVRVVSNERTAWDEEIRRFPLVREVETIDRSDGAVTYRVVFQGRTLIPLLKRLRLLRHFPIPVQDGVATWTVIGPEGKVRGLLKSLEESKVAYQVESVHHGPLPRNPSRPG